MGRWTWQPALLLATALLGVAAPAWAQEDMTLLDDVVRDGLEWAQQNLDEDLLRALGDVDQKQVQQFFQTLQQRFRGEYVVDLASLKPMAATLLPVLASNEQTRPYAAWLRSRLDYLEVAEEFRATARPPKVEPGQPPKPAPNPPPALERKVWQEHVAKQPVPKEAAPCLNRLKPLFQASRVPPQLVWLAEVESSFNASARSPVGAAGLFQLMPGTARSLGLSLRPADERLNPEKSAVAAANYLRYLYGQFKDWRLALAAYNAGEGNVRALLTRHQAKTFDQIAPRLPAETQMYVPRIEATLLKREGTSLDRLPAPPTQG